MAMKSLLHSRFYRLTLREKSVAMVFLAALLLGSFIPGRFTVSISDSLDKRLFFLTTVNRDEIKKGDYLVFKGETSHSKPLLNRNIDRLIKKVGCSQGEELIRNEAGEFFCQGVFLGKAMDTDSRRQPLPRFYFSGMVPADSFFMIGDNPRSYDSRYFGFIHADRMLHKALPLL